MRVYILEHDDRMYDMGDKYIRGVYATEALAKADLVQAEKHTGLYQSDGHDEECCAVDDWVVESGDLDGSAVLSAVEPPSDVPKP